MNDHLDAEQIARLECLKLVAGRAPVHEVFAIAEKMAAFVLNGTSMTQPEGAGR